MFPLRSWWRLPRAERLPFILYWFALRALRAAVRMSGVAATRRRLGAFARSPITAAKYDATAGHRLAQLLAIAGGRGPLPATCLPQALLLEVLLKRRGHAPCLRIGVRRVNGATDAHAWVECEDGVVGPATYHTAFEPSVRNG